MSGIILNEDCSHFFVSRSPENMTISELKQLVDNYSGDDVIQLNFNPNAQRVFYNSKAWDVIWEILENDTLQWASHDPGFDEHIVQRLVKNCKLLFDKNINPYQVWLDYTREKSKIHGHKISPWISMRMNDLHSVDCPDRYSHSHFWRDNPQFRCMPHDPKSQFDNALDYNNVQVQQYVMKLVNEYFELFDMDGLELDWMRFPRYFCLGTEEQGSKAITAMLQKIRNLADKYAAKRGHEIKIAVRIPSRPEIALGLGLDVFEWVDQKLVDQVVICTFFSSTDFDIPIKLWRRLLGTQVVLCAGLELRTRNDLKMWDFYMENTAEIVFGHAANFLYQGADRIYLFNYFDSEKPASDDTKIYSQIINDAGTLEKIEKKSRRHVVTFMDTVAPGQEGPKQLLPAVCRRENPDVFLRMPLGKIPSGKKAYIILARADSVAQCTLTVKINGELCTNVETDYNLEMPPQIKQVLYFEIPFDVLHDGYNTIAVSNNSDDDFLIRWAEVYFR